MGEIVKRMIWEKIWRQIESDFYDFVSLHCENLATEKEQIVFCELIAADDDFTKLVLKNLWEEFSVQGCSNERMDELFKIEMEKLKELI